MRVDPAKARLLALIAFVTGVALVIFGAIVWRQGNAGGLAVVTSGLADVTVGTVLLKKRRA